jgi:hypothetical protein
MRINALIILSAVSEPGFDRYIQLGEYHITHLFMFYSIFIIWRQ